MTPENRLGALQVGAVVVILTGVAAAANVFAPQQEPAPKAAAPAVATAAPAPVSEGCQSLVDVMEGDGLIRSGGVTSDGLTILVDESFTRWPIAQQTTIANCVSQVVAGSADKMLRRVTFRNQTTGVTYGTLEYSRYRVGP